MRSMNGAKAKGKGYSKHNDILSEIGKWKRESARKKNLIVLLLSRPVNNGLPGDLQHYFSIPQPSSFSPRSTLTKFTANFVLK